MRHAALAAVILLAGCESAYIVPEGAYRLQATVHVYDTLDEVSAACQQELDSGLPYAGCTSRDRTRMHVQLPTSTETEGYYFCMVGHEMAHLLEQPGNVWHGLRLWDPCDRQYVEP